MARTFFCPACYGAKVYCRFHKTTHCGCSWNDAFKCAADKAAAKKPKIRRVDRTRDAK